MQNRTGPFRYPITYIASRTISFMQPRIYRLGVRFENARESNIEPLGTPGGYKPLLIDFSCVSGRVSPWKLG